MLSEALRQRARIVVLPAQCDGLAQIALLLGGQPRMACPASDSPSPRRRSRFRSR
ncbi:hypothetical protein [Massilia aquatica]|uniref:hypothetical protein n=1 Tax=Massilia aquatica TaxID=2609000 RepID=UPI00351CFB67